MRAVVPAPTSPQPERSSSLLLLSDNSTKPKVLTKILRKRAAMLSRGVLQQVEELPLAEQVELAQALVRQVVQQGFRPEVQVQAPLPLPLALALMVAPEPTLGSTKASVLESEQELALAGPRQAVSRVEWRVREAQERQAAASILALKLAVWWTATPRLRSEDRMGRWTRVLSACPCPLHYEQRPTR